MLSTLGVASAAFCSSVALGWVVYRRLSAFGLLDVPNARSSHERPTVRGGGLAVVATIVAGIACVAWLTRSAQAAWLIVPVLTLAGVSFWDDVRSISAKIRLAVHLGAAGLGYGILCWPTGAPALAGGFAAPLGLPGWVLLGLGVLWLAGYANAFNFMDGINGHAAGQAALTAAASGLICGIEGEGWGTAPVLTAAVVTGAAAGFVPFNFPRAVMFLGDVGSVTLGFVLAFLACWLASEAGWDVLVTLVLLQLNFVYDAGVTWLRRALRGEKWFAPHREHLYERLALARGSHTGVTLVEMGVQVVAASALILVSASGHPVWVGWAAVVLAWAAYVLSAEVYCLRANRSTPLRTNHE